jgi:hypothetical protein
MTDESTTFDMNRREPLDDEKLHHQLRSSEFISKSVYAGHVAFRALKLRYMCAREGICLCKYLAPCRNRTYNPVIKSHVVPRWACGAA